MSLILFYEFYRIGVVADPTEIAKYYFGGEAMINHGGWKYHSSGLYSLSALVDAFLLLLAATGFLIAYKERSRLFIGIAVGILGITYLIQELLNAWFKHSYGGG
jgi:hypothetical protein